MTRSFSTKDTIQNIITVVAKGIAAPDTVGQIIDLVPDKKDKRISYKAGTVDFL